jgi:antitoxin (DNA-binding transcriptional repressor) of toxin-antitoxin stability system
MIESSVETRWRDAVKQTIDVSEAQSRLGELVDGLAASDEIVLVRDARPVARILPLRSATEDRIPGLGRGSITIAPDFDDPLPDEFWGFDKIGGCDK